MKRIISLLLIAILALVPLSVSAESDVKVLLDGVEIQFDQQPVIMNNRTMVPVRAIYEALGATVEWDNDTRTASGTKCGVRVSFTIDEAYVKINFLSKEIDAPAKIVNGRTLVPVRALAEGFGVKVDWDGDTKTVILESHDTSGAIENYQVDDDTFYYEGQLSNGIPEGYGTGMMLEYTDTQFVGTWENGAPAVGFLFTNDPSFGFTGFCGYAYGTLSGYSKITLPTGEIYHGNWENGVMSGYGEFHMPDGSYYKGELENNAMNGYGEMYDATTGIIHKGTWVNGELINKE